MRLLSYNIHKGIGGRDRRYRIDRILQVLEHEQPDLICLQEVDRNVRRSKFHDQPADLAEALRFEANLFQLNVPLKDGGYGNLVLSRWPIRDRDQISLRRGVRKPRGAQLLVIDTPDGLLHLINWHLGLAERERHWQVRQLLEHQAFLQRSNLPTLIVGDYNDWRNTLAKGPFTRHGFIHATAPSVRFRSFPASMPVASLDKLFYRGGITIEQIQIPRTRLTLRASDHLPLVVDFSLANGQAEPNK